MSVGPVIDVSEMDQAESDDEENGEKTAERANNLVTTDKQEEEEIFERQETSELNDVSACDVELNAFICFIYVLQETMLISY